MTAARRRPIPWQQKPLFPVPLDSIPRQASSPQAPRYQFGQVPKWLTRLNPPPRVHQLWNLLAEYAQGKGTGKCWPGQDVLAQRMGCRIRTVQRWLKELEALGAITTQYVSDGRYGRAGCIYSLHYQGPATASEEVPTRQKAPLEKVPTRQNGTSYTTPVTFLHDISDTDFTQSSASPQLCAAARNQTNRTRPKEPTTTWRPSPSPSPSPDGRHVVGPTTGPDGPGRHVARAPEDHQDDRETVRRPAAAGPVKPPTVSQEFRQQMTQKYPMLSDVSDRIDQALNHRSSAKVFNPEVFVDGWLRRDREAGAHGQPDRMGVHRVQILTDRNAYPDKF